ncbi:DNA-processing protein DprA [Ferroacidibacillus organovorans]|uniref:DNA protecting protein DprA n=1 Tax=Ferroacidibacillus organovorans TaxID=1765683 RepID=A0A161PX21_9BACL|nr:DNA-processing protein DprA [Ferroacidibacillus organovorans]KYP82142.1 hypothetical protein AYJ22_00365 [Ferroacidibacillus organovorans]OAG94425.1 hypothetical protein AYW79_05255 [Ferroacidibacillus organovorans]OPG15689.1 DNA protecting protein DprA [Ferroacidibacillus organovorans]
MADSIDRMKEMLFWLKLLSVQGIGIQRAFQIRGELVSFDEADRATIEQWRHLCGSEKIAESLYQAFRVSHEYLEEKIITQKVSFVVWSDGDYPHLLREIAAPPPFYFYKGKRLTDHHRIAIVGTRNCTSYGRHVAYETALALSNAGTEVVSGLAQGIDGNAHRGAIAGGTPTIAVLGSGVHTIYPQEHRALAQQIIDQGGSLLSEHLPWIGPQKHHFPRRNRMISGLCRAVIVVEAPVKSGALISARYALEDNREVLAVPGNITSDRSAGTNLLIMDGATPLLCSSSAPLQVGSPLAVPFVQAETAIRNGETSLVEKIIAELQTGSKSVETLCTALSLSSESAAVHLLSLELDGKIQKRLDGRYEWQAR